MIKNLNVNEINYLKGNLIRIIQLKNIYENSKDEMKDFHNLKMSLERAVEFYKKLKSLREYKDINSTMLNYIKKDFKSLGMDKHFGIKGDLKTNVIEDIVDSWDASMLPELKCYYENQLSIGDALKFYKKSFKFGLVSCDMNYQMLQLLRQTTPLQNLEQIFYDDFKGELTDQMADEITELWFENLTSLIEEVFSPLVETRCLTRESIVMGYEDDVEEFLSLEYFKDIQEQLSEVNVDEEDENGTFVLEDYIGVDRIVLLFKKTISDEMELLIRSMFERHKSSYDNVSSIWREGQYTIVTLDEYNFKYSIVFLLIAALMD